MSPVRGVLGNSGGREEAIEPSQGCFRASWGEGGRKSFSSSGENRGRDGFTGVNIYRGIIGRGE